MLRQTHMGRGETCGTKSNCIDGVSCDRVIGGEKLENRNQNKPDESEIESTEFQNTLASNI